MKIKTGEDADVNITALIDCLMQCIIFFMVIMSAQYIFGVAIKFAPPAPASQQQKTADEKKEKNVIVYVQADWIDEGHTLIQDGSFKINGEEHGFSRSQDPVAREKERTTAFLWIENRMKTLIEKEGYKKDVMLIQGDMKSYHGKIMKIVDIGKGLGIESFSLVPPTK